MAINQTDRETLANLETLLAGRRCGEYKLTSAVTYKAGQWLIDNIADIQLLLSAGETLAKAIFAIEGLADQQAMRDDFYKPTLEALRGLSRTLEE